VFKASTLGATSRVAAKYIRALEGEVVREDGWTPGVVVVAAVESGRTWMKCIMGGGRKRRSFI
jgi:hypothetical protein